MTKKKSVYKVRTLWSENKTSSLRSAIDFARFVETEFPGRYIVVEKHVPGVSCETILTINGENGGAA